jgi:DNA-binding transcriptional LysR family regulator
MFERTNGGTRPTLAGRDFLISARQILEVTDAAQRKLRTGTRGENGRLTVGVYASLSTGNMFATLVEHHRRFPEVELLTVDGGHDQLLCALAHGTVDVAVMTSSRSGWDDRFLPLWSERVIVALHSRHPLSTKDTVTWPDLVGETLLVPQQGPGPELERLLIVKLGDYRAPRILRQEAALDRLLSLVAAEYGTLLMLEGGTGIHCESVVYRELHGEEGPTRLGFTAYWRKANGNPAPTPFLELLRCTDVAFCSVIRRFTESL